MCRFKSAIIFKNRVVLAPTYNDSHSDMLERLGVEDNTLNATKMFVRAELIPPHNNKAEKVSEWKFHVDQDITPDWFDEDRSKYEEEMREAVQAWVDDHVFTAAGETWIAIKEDEKGTYYLLDRTLPSMEFGNTNNYKESNIHNFLSKAIWLNLLRMNLVIGLCRLVLTLNLWMDWMIMESVKEIFWESLLSICTESVGKRSLVLLIGGGFLLPIQPLLDGGPLACGTSALAVTWTTRTVGATGRCGRFLS